MVYIVKWQMHRCYYLLLPASSRELETGSQSVALKSWQGAMRVPRVVLTDSKNRESLSLGSSISTLCLYLMADSAILSTLSLAATPSYTWVNRMTVVSGGTTERTKLFALLLCISIRLLSPLSSLYVRFSQLRRVVTTFVEASHRCTENSDRAQSCLPEFSSQIWLTFFLFYVGARLIFFFLHTTKMLLRKLEIVG